MLNWYPGQTLATIEREVITQALRYYSGNNTLAARALGISERKIYDRIKEYKIQTEVVELRNKRSAKESEIYLQLARGHITPAEYREKMNLPTPSNERELNPEPLFPQGRSYRGAMAEGDSIEGLEDQIPTPEAAING